MLRRLVLGTPTTLIHPAPQQEAVMTCSQFFWCLQRNHGMQLIYLGPLGPESMQLVGYLTSLPGVVPLKPGHNPATWMLEVTGGAVATSARAAPLDFAAAYQARRYGFSPHLGLHAQHWSKSILVQCSEFI